MNPTPDWWKTFFNGFILDAQRNMFPESQTKAEADFLVQVLEPRPGSRIADVPCGTGRLSLELARRGHRMTGVDLTGPFLDDARKQAEEAGLSIELEQRDMRDLPWSCAFDHAFCFGNSFAYFDHSGNLAFLQALNAILKSRGRLALATSFVMEGLLPQPLGRRWYPFGEMLFLHDTAYDPVTSQLTSSYILVSDGKTERKQAVYQLYTYRELLDLFETAGFVDVVGYGSLSREPFRLGNPNLWLVARKP